MTTITPATLAALRVPNPAAWAPVLSRAAADNAIRNVTDFLANILHESGRLRTLRESLNYTPGALTRTWPGHFPAALAAQLGRIDGPHGPLRAADQWWIAEHAYGGRMGNLPCGHGDGWTFRGTGPLQITGRDNVLAFANTIGWDGPLPALADHLATPEGGAAAAGQFWRAKGCDSLSDPRAVRARINGGLNGLAEVLAIRAEVAAALRDAGPLPVSVAVPAPALSEADELNQAELAATQEST